MEEKETPLNHEKAVIDDHDSHTDSKITNIDLKDLEINTGTCKEYSNKRINKYEHYGTPYDSSTDDLKSAILRHNRQHFYIQLYV
ncbi:hypothetical protein A3Q56_08129 [Intoshia linei]|uniref:Uncharacterized protein n=1 Tax=Intoshia linei TaxID=1819745 RepID=A0A177AQ94_9BILA|nr:hypothetical protein A3Q56_08129 [Intoshia linei]